MLKFAKHIASRLRNPHAVSIEHVYDYGAVFEARFLTVSQCPKSDDQQTMVDLHMLLAGHPSERYASIKIHAKS